MEKEGLGPRFECFSLEPSNRTCWDMSWAVPFKQNMEGCQDGASDLDELVAASLFSLRSLVLRKLDCLSGFEW